MWAIQKSLTYTTFTVLDRNKKLLTYILSNKKKDLCLLLLETTPEKKVIYIY